MTTKSDQEDGTIISNTGKMNSSVMVQTHQAENMPPEIARLLGIEQHGNDTQKTGSAPSTPFQRPQINIKQQPSPPTTHSTRDGSPRSLNSDSSHTPPAPRRPIRGCRFEAGMAKARRRVPYSLGPEKLDSQPEEMRRTLGKKDEDKLTADMQELYSHLVPTPESEERRTLFVQKLESLLRSRWPGQQINVSVFGSTGNRLGTNDSDVDICITTDCKELEHVCSIADLLDKNGMERIVCVSSAKVPIVKIWDPELQVACDMNVNNPIALENTQMIRTYSYIDARFRPLAMIVKYWAKRRILNDAALGGTLSSYTWICMVLNFLQTRDPPILPTLQQQSGLAPKNLNGINVAFDRDIDAYRDFGSRNKSSLGQLLFGFFRYFGHELDFEENALSVRLGKVIPKSQKAWHLLQDNRLCIEEPFNASRNLANTADDTSMRGIHLELRRAFRMLAEGQLNLCCEQYEARPEERKQTETFIHPTARPIIPQAPTQPAAQTHRSNRNGFRGGRHNRNTTRRASNPAGRNSTYLHDLPFQMTPQELQLQAQHQQHLLHDQLFQQYQYLQLQEQELRMQLYQQSLRQRVSGQQPGSQNSFGNVSVAEVPSTTAPANASLRMTMSPNMFQNRFSTSSPFLRNSSPANGVMTNPASPLLGHVVPDGRRYTRRTSMTNPSPAGSLRAHSQPARSLPFGGGFNQARQSHEGNLERQDLSTDHRPPVAVYPQVFAPAYTSAPPVGVSGTLYDAGRRPAEYMGYYVGQSPSLIASARSTAISPLPSHAGLAIHNGGLSPRLSSRSSRLPSVTSSPSIQSTNLEDASESAASVELITKDQSAQDQPESPKLRSGPLIVDGSVWSPQRRRPAVRTNLGRNDGVSVSTSTSDDPGLDTPSSSDDQYQDYRQTTCVDQRSSNDISRDVNTVTGDISNISLEPQSHVTMSGIDDALVKINGIKESPLLNTQLSVSDLSNIDESHNLPAAEARVNGTNNRRKKSRADRVASENSEIANDSSVPLGTRTNGQDSGSGSVSVRPSEISSGWQTQKKKKRARKMIASGNHAALVNSSGGDILPLNESMRKGG